MRKKVVYLLFLFVLVFGITGCTGASNNETGDVINDNTTLENNNNVGGNDSQMSEIIFHYDELSDGTICIYDYDTDVVPDVLEIPAEYEGKKVTEIENIFNGDKQVRKVILPETLRVIGNYSFAGASALEEVEIRGTVESVGKDAFFQCDKLTKLEFKEGLKVLGGCAIFLCKNLVEIHLPASLVDVTENGNFGGCSKDLTIYGPSGSFIEKHAKERGIKFVAE